MWRHALIAIKIFDGEDSDEFENYSDWCGGNGVKMLKTPEDMVAVIQRESSAVNSLHRSLMYQVWSIIVQRKLNILMGIF